MNDVLRAQLSTWLTQALDIGGEVTETDLLTLREWIDAGCPGECPEPGVADAHLPSVGQIAEVLENHTKRLDTLTCCGLNLERPDQQYRHWAEAIRALFGEVAGDE